MENNEQNIIDLKKIFTTLWEKRKVFYWVWGITFVVSAALILCVPRKYQSTVVLAPEGSNELSMGSLGGLASSFGLDLGTLPSADAIHPIIYPNVVGSPDFLLPLFETRVVSANGKIDARYYDYMLSMQKMPFWKYPRVWCSQAIDAIKGNDTGGRPNTEIGKEFDPFWLNKIQREVLEAIQKNITCTVDKKTEMITINVLDQDKLICATIADTVSHELQKFVTTYRTQKAKVDADYFYRMMTEAAEAYQSARLDYTNYAESHIGSHQERVRTELQRLQSEMQQKHNIQNIYQQQYLAAAAKLQANTPIYTVIQSASVPEKAKSPKRVRFVLLMLILSTIVTCGWLARKDLFV